jgi:pimeloyl-ACP methyl ester carboxylesterase
MRLLHSKILGTGQPLLILHGFLGMGDNWISLGRKYAETGFEVHLIDQRNHGKSFHCDEMNYEVMLEDLDCYINHYQLKNILLMGHSMGGKTAMHYVMEYPEKITKLIVVDISPVKYPPHHYHLFDAFDKVHLAMFSSRKEVATEIENQIKVKAISNFILKNLFRDNDGKFTWKANIEILKDVQEELGEAIPAQSVFDKATLFIKGALSPYIQKHHSAEINAHFPQNQFVVIKNSGHWVHAEQAPEFYKESISFLKK